MRRRAAGFTTANWSIVDHHHGATGAGKQIRRSHPGYSSAHYTDVGAEVLGEGLELGHFGGAHPDRGRVT